MELHYFEYTPDRAQELDYYGASACQFFALARTGDEFRKAALNEFNADWVWSDLRRLAMQRADIVDVEGTSPPRIRATTCRSHASTVAWSYGAGWKACACSASCIVTSVGR
ncbi:hypothetical protein [Massilia sp. AB1]|uniref:hypothetical protein n=1 Tax=Massilia sp. AB1 TaxID=2823371 RepID=UPI001B81C06D|nr:hypothetical protein [Massilia sp. AB1]MBQ5942677.1 hypothetical protein [Massilia sp. AB1]